MVAHTMLKKFVLSTYAYKLFLSTFQIIRQGYWWVLHKIRKKRQVI